MRDAEQEESRRLARLLTSLIREAGRSIRSVEEELGLGSSSLGKVLNGTIRLQMSHILMVTAVLGMTPGQFFQLAYPRREHRHPLSLRLVTLELEKKEVEPLDDLFDRELPHFDERVRELVLRTLGDLVRKETEGAAGSGELRPGG